MAPGTAASRPLLAALVVILASGCASDWDESGLVGLWAERERMDCDGSSTEAAKLVAPVLELMFHDDGGFALAWNPFEEGYWDYFGTWRVQPGKAALTLWIDDGADVPTTTDLDGAYTLDEEGEVLRLNGIFLGTPNDGGADGTACGHVFARTAW